jgi:hypothetical protein
VLFRSVDGKWWSVVDGMISEQDLVNRTFSTFEHILGSSAKNPVLVQESLLKKGFGIEHVREELSKITPVLSVMNTTAIQTLTMPQVNPQLFNIIQFAISRMTEKAGGREQLGIQESAAASGLAGRQRAEQGGLGRLPGFDRLKLWRKEITYDMVWYLKNFLTIYALIMHIDTYRNGRLI